MRPVLRALLGLAPTAPGCLTVLELAGSRVRLAAYNITPGPSEEVPD